MEDEEVKFISLKTRYLLAIVVAGGFMIMGILGILASVFGNDNSLLFYIFWEAFSILFMATFIFAYKRRIGMKK